MNCEDLLANLGFECAPRPGGLRVFSPFTFADGTGLGVYVEQAGDKALVTDHGDAFMHLSAHGASITPRRIRMASLRCAGVEISEGGEVRAMAEVGQLGEAIASVLQTMVFISHQQRDWVPRPVSEQFVARVAEELKTVAEGRLLRFVKATGISGHQLEFPLGVSLPDQSIAFIQPIGAGDDELDWSTVYRTAGKMIDLREAGVSGDRRIVIIDDSVDIPAIPQAITLLGTSSTVLPFGQRRMWLSRFAA